MTNENKPGVWWDFKLAISTMVHGTCSYWRLWQKLFFETTPLEIETNTYGKDTLFKTTVSYIYIFNNNTLFVISIVINKNIMVYILPVKDIKV